MIRLTVLPPRCWCLETHLCDVETSTAERPIITPISSAAHADLASITFEGDGLISPSAPHVDLMPTSPLALDGDFEPNKAGSTVGGPPAPLHADCMSMTFVGDGPWGISGHSWGISATPR